MNLAEKVVVCAVIGILSAIAAPGYLEFIRYVEVSKASDRIYWQLQKTKSEARLTKTTWEFLARQTPNGIEYSVNPDDLKPNWSLMPFAKAEIDPTNTTFYFDKKRQAYRIQFNYLGVTNGQLGRITVTHKKSKLKRCVIVSTLIGALRTGKQDKKGKCN